jgi:hypothetical protein
MANNGDRVQMLQVKYLQWPGAPLYVRGKANEEIITRWTEDVKEAKRYIFDKPIDVWIPTAEGTLDKGKRWEIADGYKRAKACAAAGLKEIPGIIRSFDSHQEAFAYQFQTAMGNGEFFSKQQRAHYVKTCRDVFKLKLKQIAALTKISESQVSRIARDIKAPSAGKGSGKPKPAKRFSVKTFLEEIRFLGIQYQNYKESVDKYVETKASELTALFKAIDKALPLLAQEEAGGE